MTLSSGYSFVCFWLLGFVLVTSLHLNFNSTTLSILHTDKNEDDWITRMQNPFKCFWERRMEVYSTSE
ncbi:hypothetical protein Lalb_Chr23g0267921 [Lupinus albus]|uniref:Uncharacterized protein n=1 Tax=Lupinus albus TaxID=3870 RepID=A0A6A4NJQ0_LUPAL|nr:hypothetical protein Lalb_Chr23g0267921 [Lupinus albus]